MRPRDESITIKAFDMDKAEAYEILGQNINFVNALPSVLNDVAIVFSMGTLAAYRFMMLSNGSMVQEHSA